MKYLFIIIVGLIGIYFYPYDFPPLEPSNYFCRVFHESRLCGQNNLGAVSYPTSLDSLENPSATQSVATTKTHSQQHSDANDAIEALEAKLGIYSSTPFTNTLLVGDGSGTSRWSTWATTTNFNSQNLFITASSTLQNFWFNIAKGNQATTTSFGASSIIALTYASTSQLYADGLITCQSTNFLQWTGGKFGCGAGAAGITTFSTTTSVDMSTSTIPSASIPTTDHLHFVYYATSTGANYVDTIVFNGDTTGSYSYGRELNGNGATSFDNFGGTGVFVQAQDATPNTIQMVTIDIYNPSGNFKYGTMDSVSVSTTSPSSSQHSTGHFMWKNNSRITQIDIGCAWRGNATCTLSKGNVYDLVGY